MKTAKNLLFIKIAVLYLIFYNFFVLSVLYTDNLRFKGFFWKITPYDYKRITLSPNHFSKKSLLEKKNQNLILEFLNKNKQRNYLDITYWNYKKTIESFDNENKLDFEKSFYKLFILSENNPDSNLIYKKTFIKNYINFSKEYRDKIIEKFIIN
ncbi:hypothetical protein PQZ72_00025 [Candidatus Pelagibacter sp.]|nr:hypothetical protein [Candidatus Pelagibacter sp.]MDC6475638.1 hypothetical protein [Candidatus Pelagibacter sp.]